MVERADMLTAPPVVGRFYLVPSVLWSFSSTWGEPEALKTLQALPDAKWWPVWGRKHDDREFFKFEFKHYHLDPRFLTKRHWKEFEWGFRSPLGVLQGKPLNHRDLPNGPPRPQLRRMKCTSLDTTWEHAGQKTVLAMQAAFAGKQCRASKVGIICPHQRFPLGSIAPVDGVITCPLHGLRIDAASGRVLAKAEPA